MKTAMILAAGRGQRLRPITDKTPKPLVEVGSYRLIEYHLYALSSAGFDQIIINVSHLGEKIEHYLGNGQRYGVEILYSREPEGALETAGGIIKALPLIVPTEFLVVNGDVFCDVDFTTLTLSPDMDMHLLLVENPPHNSAGDFALDSIKNQCLVNEIDSHSKTYTFSGIGVYRKRCFTDLAAGKRPLAPLIRRFVSKKMVAASIHHGTWIDVGDQDRLTQARTLASSSTV